MASGDICKDMRPSSIRPISHNKLSDAEVAAILMVGNQKDYANLPPSQIVPSVG